MKKEGKAKLKSSGIKKVLIILALVIFVPIIGLFVLIMGLGIILALLNPDPKLPKSTGVESRKLTTNIVTTIFPETMDDPAILLKRGYILEKYNLKTGESTELARFKVSNNDYEVRLSETSYMDDAYILLIGGWRTKTSAVLVSGNEVVANSDVIPEEESDRFCNRVESFNTMDFTSRAFEYELTIGRDKDTNQVVFGMYLKSEYIEDFKCKDKNMGGVGNFDIKANSSLEYYKGPYGDEKIKYKSGNKEFDARELKYEQKLSGYPIKVVSITKYVISNTTSFNYIEIGEFRKYSPTCNNKGFDGGLFILDDNLYTIESGCLIEVKIVK